MLIYWNGVLLAKKASVFWMEYQGEILSAEWQVNVIKWGDDYRGLPEPFLNREKWDQMIFEDIDQDCDFDIVANCEEYNTMGIVFLAVFWFENPII